MSISDQLKVLKLQYAELKFAEPDNSVGAEQRAFYAIPASKEFKIETLPLYDLRTDPKITHGPAGLDKHGFTMVNHTSALSGEEWFLRENIENIYYNEVKEIIKNLTGSKDILIHSVGFRRKKPSLYQDPMFYRKRDVDEFIHPENLDLTKPLYTGISVEASVEPARGIHCDFSRTGLHRLVRFSRPDITAAGAAVLAAEDEATRTGQSYAGPRYASYSVWRPLKTVHRDPIVVGDSCTIEREVFVPYEHRVPAPGGVGEFISEGLGVKPSKDPSRQRWYWVPEQRTDEVMVIKFADSEADKGTVSAHTAHGSPHLVGSEGVEEARESIEVRVIVFW